MNFNEIQMGLGYSKIVLLFVLYLDNFFNCVQNGKLCIKIVVNVEIIVCDQEIFDNIYYVIMCLNVYNFLLIQVEFL